MASEIGDVEAFQRILEMEFQYASDRALIDATGRCPICGLSAEAHPLGFESCPESVNKPRGLLAALDPDVRDVVQDTVEAWNRRDARDET